MSNEHISADENSGPLKPMERALAGFSPAAPQIDRDRLMFLAGQASEQHRVGVVVNPSRPLQRAGSSGPLRHGSRWLWPASTAVLAATSLALAVALFLRPGPQPLVVYRDRPSEAVVAAASQPRISPHADKIVSTVVSEVPPTHVASNNYVRTREVALRMGLDALGSPATPAGGGSAPATYFELLRGLGGARQLPNGSAARLPDSSTM
jgi:hypothetical protein